ncbi:MAG: hypothetical protein ACM3VT_16290, partial [Solirubrobacterales bacterium]
MSTRKSFSRAMLVLGTIGLAVGCAAAVAKAQSAPGTRTTRLTAASQPDTGPATTDVALRRATRLIGEPLRNTQGVKLGKIDDL